MKTFIGIDIGKRFTKVVQSFVQKKKICISKFFLFETPYEKDKIAPKEFFEKITSNIPKEVLKKAQIGISIPSPSTNLTIIELPKMSPKELKSAVVLEAKRKIIPSPGPESTFEYAVLREIKKQENVYYEILVLKTERVYIEEVLNLFKFSNGLLPSLITPLCSVVPLFLLYEKDLNSDSTAFINIGYDSLDIIITKDRKLNFYRNVKFGLKDIIQKISKNLNLTFQEAEELVKKEGVPTIDINLEDRIEVAEQIMRQRYEAFLKEDKRKKINLLELKMLWQTEIERIVQEIRRSLIYYKELTKGERVRNLFFFGGGLGIKGLFKMLTKKIGGRSKILRPFEYFEVSYASTFSEEIMPLFAGAVAVNLGLLVDREKLKVVNFLPPELKKREVIAARKLILIVIFIFILFFICLNYVNLLVNNYRLKSMIKNLNVEIKDIKKVVKMVDEFKEKKRLIFERSEKIKGLMKKKFDLSVILKEIARFTPPEVLIDTLYIGSNYNLTESSASLDVPEMYKLRIEAQILSSYEDAIEIIKKFKLNLERSPYFANVKVDFPKLKKFSFNNLNTKNLPSTLVKIRKFNIRADIVKK